MSTLKLKLKRVDPVKYATISAILTVLIVLIIAVPMMAIFSAVGAGASASTETLGPIAILLTGGIFGIIMVVILYGIFAFVFTLILTAILNFILKKTGGLELDFEKRGTEFSNVNSGSGNPRIES